MEKLTLIAAFEEAVAPERARLVEMYYKLGDLAVEMKESDPSADPWKSFPGKVHHCIGGALQVLTFASMGEFRVASQGLAGYVLRLEAIERNVPADLRPVTVVEEIKTALDRVIDSHPQIFTP